MANRFLEDIVETDLKERRALRTIRTEIRDSLDNVLTRHPILTAAGTYLILDYLRQRLQLPESFIQGATYLAYSTVGLIKEYLVEGRKQRPPTGSGFYSWLLHNPKLAALYGAIIGGTIVGNAEAAIVKDIFHVDDFFNLPPIRRMDIVERTISGAVISGTLTEIISRGLKNVSRIKRSIKRIKTRTYERAWNFIFEHPFILPAAATLATFSVMYSSPIVRTYRTETAHGRRFILTGHFLDDIVSHPGKMFYLGIQAAVVGAAALAVNLGAGSLLHTHSIREGYHRAARTFGRRETRFSHQYALVALPNNTERTIEDLVELGNMHYEEGDKENAYRCYRRAIRLLSKKSDQVSYADIFRKTFGITRLRRRLKRFMHKKDSEENAINLMFINLLNKDQRALDSIKAAVDKDPENPRLIYLYGKALEVLGYKESARAQKQKAIEKILSSAFFFRNLEGSKNTVVLFGDEMLREEVIAKTADTSHKLLAEMQSTERLRKILEDFDQYDTPVPIALMRYGSEYYYVMEQASGELLTDRIRQGAATLEDFGVIADFMGLIHARLEPEQSLERNYVETIRTRLSSARISRRTIDTICGNLYPVIYTIATIARVYNRDSHPGNWIRDEFGGIVAIDLEGDRVVPLTFDTANLIDHYDYLTDIQKEAIFMKHLKSFERYSGTTRNIDINKYRLAYLNSVVIRALEKYAQVKDLDMDAATGIVTNSQKAIARIATDFQEYYTTNKQAYDKLYEALGGLKPN